MISHELMENRGRQNGCRGRLLQKSAIQRQLCTLLLKAESAASEGERGLKNIS